MSRDAERHGTTEEGVETETKKQGKPLLHSGVLPRPFLQGAAPVPFW